MITKIDHLEKYRDKFLKEGVELTLLHKGEEDIKRMAHILVGIDSKYLFPTEDETRLYEYAKKLVDNAYNFILTEENRDIGTISLYANDFVTKTAYTSTIGIIPSYRGGRMIKYLVEMALDFAKEVGMVYYRAEVHKANEKWANFLIGKFGFQIESETENGTYMIVKKL